MEQTEIGGALEEGDNMEDLSLKKLSLVMVTIYIYLVQQNK